MILHTLWNHSEILDVLWKCLRLLVFYVIRVTVDGMFIESFGVR